MGLFVWEEVMAWGTRGTTLGSKRWLGAQLQALALRVDPEHVFQMVDQQHVFKRIQT